MSEQREGQEDTSVATSRSGGGVSLYSLIYGVALMSVVFAVVSSGVRAQADFELSLLAHGVWLVLAGVCGFIGLLIGAWTGRSWWFSLGGAVSAAVAGASAIWMLEFPPDPRVATAGAGFLVLLAALGRFAQGASPSRN